MNLEVLIKLSIKSAYAWTGEEFFKGTGSVDSVVNNQQVVWRY